ncbi:aminotransferase [Pacificibacter marinus]|uniref:aminotransferase n=1 Tax=Pacificibacter marinus TaxID=658057 RepID=UPI001C0778CF|nr:aminotransferase [Pacificibacter marinus]MBU2867172.1 aminotransferase [Pacificibacter marinus]
MSSSTPLPLSTAMQNTMAPPIMEASTWLEGVSFSADKPLINLSQAAPTQAPPLALRREMARIAVEDDSAHHYGDVLGLPALRGEIANQWSSKYHGQIKAEDVAITSGCNQAFTAVMSTLCAAGDEIILPTPWYFNHKMWADMNGVSVAPLMTGPDLLPDLESAAKLITPRTRAIVLVSPNNPGGVEYPAELVTQFYALAKARRIALVIDETYRDFDARDGVPHYLFQQPDWRETVVQLYSFSKVYRMMGHRVGAIVASPARLAQVEKYLDTVTICPNQLAQKTALWAMQNLSDWVAAERVEILTRRAAIEDGFKALSDKGWHLRGCGAYFAYVEHPFDMPSSQLAPWLVKNAALLVLPGTMFMPKGHSGGEKHLRIAFANADLAQISQLFDRLAQIEP